MPKSRRRKKQRHNLNNAQQRPSSKPILTIPAPGLKEPLDAIFYLPGKCAVCEHAPDPMIATAWRGGNGSHYACCFCLKCAFTVMRSKTQQERGDFYREIEMQCDCEAAQDAIAESEAGR